MANNNAEDLAHAKVLPSVPETQLLQRVDVPLSESITEDKETENPAAPPTKISRSLSASKIYSWNDPNLVKTIGQIKK